MVRGPVDLLAKSSSFRVACLDMSCRVTFSTCFSGFALLCRASAHIQLQRLPEDFAPKALTSVVPCVLGLYAFWTSHLQLALAWELYDLLELQPRLKRLKPSSESIVMVQCNPRPLRKVFVYGQVILWIPFECNVRSQLHLSAALGQRIGNGQATSPTQAEEVSKAEEAAWRSCVCFC